jgi:DNA-binding CsgD family transcriptional regulator
VPIAAAMHVSVGRTAVLVSALYLASSIAQPTAGKLSEEFWPRRVFLSGILLVLVGGLAGGFAQDLTSLIVARVLIGVGTSTGYPSAMLLIRRRAEQAGLDTPPGNVLGGLVIAGMVTCDRPALERDMGLADPDRVLFPALICVSLGLLERRAGHGPAHAALVSEIAGLLGEASGPAPPAGEPAWPCEPLTQSQTRVVRYLPTHMGAPEIAAELYLSANTVKTHLRHLYRKLGAHSRQEAVHRARAIGLLTASYRRP